jgi:branched-chain amino acid transport system ATP-binding protein
MLNINNIEVMFDGAILVLKGISFTAHQGKITTLLGANGAGKTTTLKAISGLPAAERGAVTSGSIELDGKRIDLLPPHDIVAGNAGWPEASLRPRTTPGPNLGIAPTRWNR